MSIQWSLSNNNGGRIIALLLAALFHHACADEFTSPSNSNADLSVKYKLGQTVQLSWDCALSDISLLVSHWGGNTIGSLLSDATNPGVFTWTIGENDNVDDEAINASPNFVLLIRDPSGEVGTGGGFVNNQLSSRAFVIESNVTSSSSSSSSSSTSSSVSSTSSSAVTTSASTSNSSLANTPATATPSASDIANNSETGLSTGTKIGIGVGAAVGALILIGLGVFLGTRFVRRSRNKQNTEALAYGPNGGMYEVAAPVGEVQKPGLSQYGSTSGGYTYQSVSELPSSSVRLGSTAIQELGDGRPHNR